jgi:hypothetical protein
MFASRAAATITATQTAEAKKKKRERDGPVVSSDTTTVSSGIQTINIDEEEEDVKSPDMATVPPAETPRKVTAQRSWRRRHPVGPSRWRSTRGRAQMHWVMQGLIRG